MLTIILLLHFKILHYTNLCREKEFYAIILVVMKHSTNQLRMNAFSNQGGIILQMYAKLILYVTNNLFSFPPTTCFKLQHSTILPLLQHSNYAFHHLS